MIGSSGNSLLSRPVDYSSSRPHRRTPSRGRHEKEDEEAQVIPDRYEGKLSEMRQQSNRQYRNYEHISRFDNQA